MLRQFQPAWSPQDDSSSQVDAALQTLGNSQMEGLHPEDFDVSAIKALRQSLTSASTAETQNELDIRLTYALTRYVSQLCFGRIGPREINPEWPETRSNCDVAQIVNDTLQQKNIVGHLAEQLSPDTPEYKGLRAALQRYREIEAQGGWQAIGKVGKRGVRVDSALLASNLMRLGDLQSSAEPPTAQAVNEALRHFQVRHGLSPSGKLDEKTAAAMNVSVAERIQQIEINMDRMRWIANGLEQRHIRVNVPAFQLSVHDGEEVPLEMKAIVGSQEDPTPILDSEIKYLVFSPYWNIPLSIATKELLPKIQKNPAYFEREKIEVVKISGDKVQKIDSSKIDWDKEQDLSEYQLRQQPGAKNALGLVKFIFPNSYHVYLHDTPADNLFGRLTRTLSHGCVRLERPAELAAYLLQDQPEWTPERIEEAMHAEKEKQVSLKSPMPIHLLYWTAWADRDGTTAQFRDDVYGYDARHRELTANPASSPLPAAESPN